MPSTSDTVIGFPAPGSEVHGFGLIEPCAKTQENVVDVIPFMRF
jgi:hypothetical protein